MGKPVYCLAVQDNNGINRAYLEEQPMGDGRPSWYYVYNNRHEFMGAGKDLQAAIEMARDKTGITFSEMPALKRSEIRIVKGSPVKIVGFQGGGFYRHDTVYHGDVILGTFYQKNQPARRHNNSSSTIHDGRCVMGWDLSWLVAQHGFRLVDDAA